MKKEIKLYILDWGNGMVGIFRDSDLSQAANTTKKLFVWSLKHVMNLDRCNSIEIQFLENREELQRMREERGLERKPTLDEYLANI